MDERSGELNKALEKGVVFILALQPQVFQDVMGLVILLRVEADEIRQVAGIESFCVEAERLHVRLNALCLLKRLRCHPSTG
jgi:hypothetical protein